MYTHHFKLSSIRILRASIASILRDSRIAAETESSAPPPKRQRVIPQPNSTMALLDGLADDAGALPESVTGAGDPFNLQLHEETMHWGSAHYHHLTAHVANKTTQFSSHNTHTTVYG